MTIPSGVLCKGAWVLGTACGQCDRCHEEARRLIPLLVAVRQEASALADAYPDRCTHTPAKENCHCGQIKLERALDNLRRGYA